MRIYHRTSFAVADEIVSSRTIRASSPEHAYNVNSGPFFFVEGNAESETPTGLNNHEVVLEFECGLEVCAVNRDSQHTRDLNAGRANHLRRKLILEHNPYRSDELMQARIVPKCEACLTLIGYEARGIIGWRMEKRWLKLIRERPLVSVDYWVA